MTSDPILRLVYGQRVLNLNDGSRYLLEPDFTPPPANLSAQMSDGTSANRTGGAVKIGQRAQNRQWSFNVQVLGTSERDVKRGLQDLAIFTGYAGTDKAQPLYLEYKPNSDVDTQPIWGQDGWLRYEIRHATPPTIGERYGSGEFRARNVPATINVEIAPYAEGLPQRLCTATGGIVEDTLGTEDGLSRGLVIPPAASNLFTNPVFRNATWNTGWTAAASLIAASSIDERFLIPGTVTSVKLTATASTLNTFLQDVTLSASQHMIWGVIKLPDSGTPASTVMQMAYNGSTLSTDYTSAGNGLWYAVASALGTGGAASAGVVVKNGKTIYLAAVQAEKSTYRTPLCWGDLLGCAWSGTAHASTSTRTVASCKLPTSSLDLTNGGVRIVVRFDVSDAYATNMVLLDARDAGAAANSLLLHWVTSDNKFYLQWGGVSVTSTAQSFTAGTTFVIHAFWGSDGLALYVNGVADGTGSFAYVAPQANLFIGSIYSAAFHTIGLFNEVVFYSKKLTATQVANDYANLAPLIADGVRVGAIPFLWTKDGDDVVDNCNDISGSTGAPHNNWCVVGGIPGTAPAKTKIVVNVGSNFDADNVLWLSLANTKNFVSPAQQDSAFTPALFADLSGTTTSVADCGGAVTTSSVNTTVSGPTVPLFEDEAIVGKQILLLARLADAGANLQISVRLSAPGSGMSIISDWKPITADATQRLFVSNYLFIPDDIGLSPDSSYIKNFLIGIGLKRSVAGAANVTTDWIAFWPRPHAKISKTLSISGDQSIYINEYTALVFNPGTNEFFEQASYVGDRIEFLPQRVNLLQSILGDHGAANVVTRTMTYSQVVVNPRWELL